MPIFNPNIPQAPHIVSNSQQDLLDNNQALDDTFAKNHVRFSSNSAQNGKHNLLEMVNTPILPTDLAKSTGTLYTKKVNGVSELFYAADAFKNEYQLTNTSVTEFASWAAGPSGWVFIGGNVIMQYGLEPHNTESSLVINFPVTFSVLPYSIQVTPITDNGTEYQTSVSAFTAATFTVITDAIANLTGVAWVALGAFDG